MITLKYLKPGGLTLAFFFALLGLMPLSVTLAAPTFNDPGFGNTWNRVDKPVEDLAGGAGRGYTWGPAIPQATGVTKEPYNGGQRTVQYFDKARMEVNNPNANPQDLYYVTTGLLVKELVTGKRQDGDNNFSQQLPSQVQVAGDTNENGANHDAPTYASFQYVGTFSGTENGQPSAIGQVVNRSINRSGTVTIFTPPEQRLIAGYDDVTKHNIPDVFVTFANAVGPIWNGNSTVNGKVLFDNPTYVLGRPLTEPYWTHAVVRNVDQDILVQLFERRVLTYTPVNPDPYKVEMGNVGQHYYRWRYSSTAPQTITKLGEFGKDLTGMETPVQVAVDNQHNTFVLTRNIKGIQKYDAAGKFITSWGKPGDYNDRLVVDSQGNVYRAGYGSQQVEKWDNNGNPLAPVGSPGSAPGQFEAIGGLGIDRQDNLYVLNTSNEDLKKKTMEEFDRSGKLINYLDLSGVISSYISNIGSAIAVDSQGNLYIDGIRSNTVASQWGAIIKLDSTGRYLDKLDDPTISAYGAVIDSNDNLFVTDQHQLIKLDKSLKVLGRFSEVAIPADQTTGILGLATDQQGNLYCADFSLNWVQKFNSQGSYLGRFGSYASGPGQLHFPGRMSLDGQGNIFVANTGNARVEKFDGNGNLLLEFGSRGEGNGQFLYPTSVVADKAGNIYVVDQTNQTIQKFDRNGLFLQRWGNFPGGTTDRPYRLGIDGQDNIYVLFDGSHTLKRYNNQGQFLNSIGQYGTGHDQLNFIEDFAVDRIEGQPGKVYLLDVHAADNYLGVQQYDSAGNFLGSLDNLQNPDGLNSFNPQSLAVDRTGNVYVGGDKGRIKKFDARAGLLADWKSEIYSPESAPDIQSLVVDSQDHILALDTSGDRLLKLGQS